jgi:hypothetical protein
MLYGASSFRKSAFALTTIAALASFSVFPAAAQQVATNSSSPACAGIADSAAAIKCEFNESVKRTQAAQQRGVAADGRAAAAQSSAACMEDVTKQIAAAKKIGPLSPEQKILFKTQIEHCDKG